MTGPPSRPGPARTNSPALCSSSDGRKMSTRRSRMLRIVALSPFIFVGLCLLFLVFEHFRGMISLARYRRAQAAEGPVLTPADLVSELPKGENGAPEVMAAARAIVKGTVLPDYYPPRMRITPSGRAVVGSSEDEWMGDKVTNRWDDLAADVHA